eukprot:2827115-Amphidinium_carterae.2
MGDSTSRSTQKLTLEMRVVFYCCHLHGGAGMGLHLPENALQDPCIDALQGLSTHAIDVDAQEEGTQLWMQILLPKKGQSMLGQECKDWLLDFTQYQKNPRNQVRQGECCGDLLHSKNRTGQC